MSLGRAWWGTHPPGWSPAPPQGPCTQPHPGACPPDRAMVVRSCWHARPVFRLTVRVLQDPDHENHMTALVFFTEASGRGWGRGAAPPGAVTPGGRGLTHIRLGGVAEDPWVVTWSLRP